MRERVAFAGGTIAVESSADGTRILLTLPAVRRPNAEQSDLADGMSPSPNVADSG